MRRSDRQVPPDRRWSALLPKAAPLPLPVYRDFIEILFGMRLPIFGMGLVFAAIAALVAWHWQDPVFAALSASAVLITAVRLAMLSAYQRAGPIGDASELRRWEQRYALGGYAIALLVGLLNMRALSYDYPLLHLITVSLAFGFGAGVVSRISVRPAICVATLLLATVPTAIAITVHAFVVPDRPLHTELFVTEAFLIVMITALSLQTVLHLYRSAVQHHTAEHDLALLAKRDALTGLPNRLLLRERFQDARLAAACAGSRLAMHFIDLDGFKPVNDTHGHPAGDAVLEEVARRLQAAARTTDTVARLGGDEFVILQTDVAHEGEAEMLARRIIKRLSAPYDFEGTSISISASVGIATTPEVEPDLGLLLAGADGALYRSKQGGKSKLTFSTREDVANARRAA